MNNLTIYKLKSKELKGQCFISYKNGVTDMLINEWKDCKVIELVYMWPFSEDQLHDWAKASGIEVKELKPRSVADKCAMFITMYKEYRNLVYTPRKVELANLKHVTMNQELLKTYFMAKDYPFSGPKSITDYIRNYNAVRDLQANGKPIKTSFPDVYDKDYERNLGDNTAKLQLYWQHLRSLGWAKIDGAWVIKQMHNKNHYES